MNVDNSLDASFWFMVVLQTMGSVDMPGSGDRKMPAPRAYLATLIIWAVLQIAADAGYARPARISAWLVVLTSLVFGPFGSKVADLFTKVASNYSTPAPLTPAQGDAASNVATGAGQAITDATGLLGGF